MREASFDAIVDSIDGGKLELGLARGGAEVWTYHARLSGSGFVAHADVYDLGGGIADFFDYLATNFAGWEGERIFASLENQLRLNARHDGKGRITLRAELGSVAPPEWTATSQLAIAAGAHADRVARDIRRFVAAGARP